MSFIATIDGRAIETIEARNTFEAITVVESMLGVSIPSMVGQSDGSVSTWVESGWFGKRSRVTLRAAS